VAVEQKESRKGKREAGKEFCGRGGTHRAHGRAAVGVADAY
jgi:hypothetical protein